MKSDKQIADYISVEEAVAMRGHVSMEDAFHALTIYRSTWDEAHSDALAAGTAFRAGYVAGKRAEREKRQQEGKQNEAE